MGLSDFKKRWSSNTSRKQTSPARSTDSSDLYAPAPTVPMDSKRVQQVRMEKQRSEVSSSSYASAPPNFSKHVERPSAPTTPRKTSEQLPSTVNFDDELSTAGEALYNLDFPAEVVPKISKPYRARDFAPLNSNPSKPSRTSAMDDGFSMDDSSMPYDVQPRMSSPVRIVPSRDSTPASYRAPRQTESDHPPMPKHELAFENEADSVSSPTTSRFGSSRDSANSIHSQETKASSAPTSNSLPALQTKNAIADGDHLEPLMEDDPSSFDLVAPETGPSRAFQLEERSDMMFSKAHLQEIFKDTKQLLRFTNFLSAKRPASIPLLVYYLDALKALHAVRYANAVAEALTPIEGFEFSQVPPRPTMNTILEDKAAAAFDALVKDDLPAFITFTFIRVVSLSIQRRITGTLPSHLREASEGLAEVFCLSDPSRQDNPLVFTSEEFHRTTQYGVNYAIGRNCRFLQGPRTNKHSVARLAQAVKEQREVSEVFLNYRRDGSPFMNLLMCAPLLDSRGKTRYFIGAQVDVSGLCKEGTDLPGLQTLIAKAERGPPANDEGVTDEEEEKDAFQELVEMFNETELNMVRQNGGKMHREHIEQSDDDRRRGDRPRLLIKEPSDPSTSPKLASALSLRNGRLEGVYQNYLLLRPYPSLRILFCSPSLRIPGLLQSSFMDRIGGSTRVRETLTAALADGRGVTAKVRWNSGRNYDEEGRARWIHCTPLLGQNGAVGVWMVVLVEDEQSAPQRKWRPAPPVETSIGDRDRERERDGGGSRYDDFGRMGNGTRRRGDVGDGVRAAFTGSTERLKTTGSAEHSVDSFTIEPA